MDNLKACVFIRDCDEFDCLQEITNQKANKATCSLPPGFVNSPATCVFKLANLTESEDLETFARVLRSYIYDKVLASILDNKNDKDNRLVCLKSLFKDDHIKAIENINSATLPLLKPLSLAIRNAGIKEKDCFTLYPIFFEINRVQNELNRINFFSHNKSKENDLQIEIFRQTAEFDKLKGKKSNVYEQFIKIINSKENLMMINFLTRNLNRFMSKELDSLSLKKRKLIDSLQVVQNTTDSKEVEQKIAEYEKLVDSKRISIEIVWREVALLTNASQESHAENNSEIFSNCLELMFKGQPFEILDGDNFDFNNAFLKNVFQQRNIKIKVVSILGPQNSGKSTLLNFMFGCDFSVNDGRCTRGIYGSLIKSNDTDFDYFLILDTEGTS